MGIIEDLQKKEEIFWLNPNEVEVPIRTKIHNYGFVYVQAAQNRFMRFLPYIASAFPETAPKKGNIESDLIDFSNMKTWLNSRGANLTGKLYLKDDAHLPIAGSVKARGGIHEVLKIAESLAQRAEKLKPTDNYKIIDSDEFRSFYSNYKIQVGSTGNLGISIGRMAAKLGFQAIVHMSSDAKEWKKELLRKEGVIVKEYDGDYSEAVAKGRLESGMDENSFFVDDENSKDLFFGYSTAALRLRVQCMKAGINVDANHPLFVYIPCGVGGAPGGITFGLKQMFGEHVHCFFVEPTEAPCVLLGMASGKGNLISVQDIGLSGKTKADGLAVGRASGFVCQMMETLLSGCFTISDDRLDEYQSVVKKLEDVFLEPSACAGFRCLELSDRERTKMEQYLEKHNLKDKMDQATHIVWATGGGLLEKQING